jgi:hypothetical protein
MVVLENQDSSNSSILLKRPLLSHSTITSYFVLLIRLVKVALLTELLSGMQPERDWSSHYRNQLMRTVGRTVYDKESRINLIRACS